MYKIILVLVIFVSVNASEFDELVTLLDNNRVLHSKDYEIKSAKAYYKSQQGLNYPTLDIKSSYIHLKQTPQSAIYLPSLPTQWVDTSKKDIYEGQIMLSYPLFSGFAIQNMITKSKLQLEIARLKKDDLKRNLKLQLAILYGNLYALKANSIALREAIKALESSYKKSKGFYKVGLIPQSELLNIRANLYKIKADLATNNSKMEVVNNNIFYLTSKYAKATSLPNITLNNKEFTNRADIKVLKKLLLIDNTDIKLSKSNNYPKINMVATYKRVADSISLDSNSYANIDQSYVGVEFKYNIFNGFSDKYKKQSAKAKYIARKLFLNDYIKKVELNIKNEHLKLDSLQQSLKWANEALVASSQYLQLALGRYNQQLVSSDELDNAIANNAKNKAMLEKIKSDIFIQKSKINLMH